jgi:predicted AlkP superfamily pyrophosphatase or phosphodiesterase
MSGSTIVILIDALGAALAERHGFYPPSLPARARVKTVLGFSQAALASIVTGLPPEKHELWMMYSFARKSSPFAWLALMPRSASARRLWLRRLIRWELAHVSHVRGYYSLYDVPREIFPRLDLPARRDIFTPRGAGKVRTIFDDLDGNSVPYMVWDYRIPEARAFDELEEAVRREEANFYFLYTAGLDSDLHRCGTTAPRVKDHLAWYRDRIERVAGAARGVGGADMVVLGDHGMCDVTSHIDIMGPVEALGLEIPRDFVPFYDSTMARFKLNSTRSRDLLEKLLSSRPSGRIMKSGDLKGLGAAFPDGRFGDLVFLADPGVIILPSYMGSEPMAAMHGYHPDTEGMYSVMLSNRGLPSRELSLCDVAGIVLPGFKPGDGGEAP